MEVPDMPRITMLLGIASLATAAAVLAQQPQPKPELMPEKSLSGEVASVDVNDKTITVKERATDPPEKSMTFIVDEQTKIASRMEGAEKGLKLPDLEAGDRVIVKYTASAGKNIAESIEVLRRDPTSSN
jgi:Cu/Ag efflux protein CusF